MMPPMSPPPPRAFALRFLRLHVGLFLFAASVTTMLEAKIGLDPWTSLHQGASHHLSLTIGTVTQGTGLILIATSWLFLKVRPGLGTVFNMLMIGPWIDLLRSFAWFPRGTNMVDGTMQFLCGILLMGIATALYIGARLGAGPRDGFNMGLSRRLGRSLRMTRMSVELCVLLIGFLLGGSIGLGTLIFALAMGPVMQTALDVFRISHDPSPQ